MIDTGLTNYPVLISTTDTDLKNNAHNSGNDIIFLDTNTDWTTGNITNRYPHETEYWSSSNGELVAWVKLDSITSGTNTSLYMYYGSPCTTNKQDPENVWDENYVMVQHLNDTSGVHHDSTSNNNDGTYTGSLQDSNGIIDGADAFDGSDDKISISHDSTLQFSDGEKISIELWVKPDDFDDYGTIIGKVNQSDTNNRNYLFYLWHSDGANTGKPKFIYRDTTDSNWHRYSTSSWQTPTSSFSHLAFTYTFGDGSSAKMYRPWNQLYRYC